MSRKVLIGLCAALTVFAFGTMTAGEASGAWLRIQKKGAVKAEAFLAIYGFPASGAGEEPVGGGLGLNYGFGQNMLFQASTGAKVGENLKLVLPKATSESCDSFIGGTLMSNNTGKNRPLSFGIQFADFQCNKIVGVGPVAAYADTQDQKWIAEICEPGAEECRPEPLNEVKNLEKETVKIEHVAFNLGPGVVVQGAVWGKWENGKKAGEPPCIKLQKKPANAPADQNLMVTESGNVALANVGETATNVEGRACLTSANNDWYSQGTEKEEPIIEITE